MKTIDFTGKNYIITGAGGSIGSAITEIVVSEGGNVCAIDIDEKALIQLGEKLNSPRYHYRVMDLSSPAVIRTAFTEIIHEFGRLHGLVNCVGVLSTKLFEEITQEEWDRVININTETLVFT